jgi:hypothetical protein
VKENEKKKEKKGRSKERTFKRTKENNREENLVRCRGLYLSSASFTGTNFKKTANIMKIEIGTV